MKTVKNAQLELSTAAFINEVAKRRKKSARPICWILGSGASRQSDIKMGRDLTAQWLRELHKQSKSKLPIENWAAKEFADIPGFVYARAVNHWPFVYQKRFAASPLKGFSFLEQMQDGKVPSPGYAILAQIMASTKHNVAITTYIENLLQDALRYYTDSRPFDCGSDTFASYVALNLPRPVIARLHRDLLLTPKGKVASLAKLPKQWNAPLASVFETHTPVIIGFGDLGGSGGSVARFLRTLPPIAGGFYWCYRVKPGFQIANDVKALVERHNGQLVPILGFDELMLQLWDVFHLALPRTELEERFSFQAKLSANYTQDFSSLVKRVLALKGDQNTATESCAIEAAEEVDRNLRNDANL